MVVGEEDRDWLPIWIPLIFTMLFTFCYKKSVISTEGGL